MKHGPIALIDAEMPTVAIATPDHTYEKTASNIEEIKARGGKIIAVIARGDEQVRRSADFVIEVPVIAECLMPIVVSVPLHCWPTTSPSTRAAMSTSPAPRQSVTVE